MSDDAQPRTAPDATPRGASSAAERAAWSSRFGWLVGALLGLVVGFVATFLLETHVLRGRVADPTAVATRASSLVVGAAFLAGALAGHAFGARGGAPRMRLLASAAGVCIAAALWAFLVIAR